MLKCKWLIVSEFRNFIDFAMLEESSFSMSTTVETSSSLVIPVIPRT